MPSEILSKYSVNPAEYEASYKAVCKTVPVEKLVEAVEFAANYFPVDEHSLVVPFEIDNSETAHANNNARCLPSNINSSALPKNNVSRNTTNCSITATTASSSTVNSPRALVIATVDKPVASSFDSSSDNERTSDQRQIIPFEKDIQEDVIFAKIVLINLHVSFCLLFSRRPTTISNGVITANIVRSTKTENCWVSLDIWYQLQKP